MDINHCDRPLPRRGWYNPDDLQVFNRRERGGIYWFTGGLNIRACLAWVVASTVGLLFLDSSLYVGPWSALADGIDLSWLSATFMGRWCTWRRRCSSRRARRSQVARAAPGGPPARPQMQPHGLAADGSEREL